MQLTRLDIKGFKSFGDKTTIHFNDGVTAIVGPNGCGKSNVVDAIRWVLGEQSTKNLRSEKMENIIFNGTKTRKAAQLAEVSLSFNNNKDVLPTSYSQVTITRKLYRSGESEYRLNDVQCRLKDITDLFLDTGIGSDSYAIIELKMVDEIINNKDNSRRALFEEASAISKYRIRKKQTFSRLKDTEADLSRIDDLLIEIEKNLKSLEYQAKKTERYYRLKDQYKQFSIALASSKIKNYHESLRHLKDKENIQIKRSQELISSLSSQEGKLKSLKGALNTEEKNLSVQQKSLNTQTATIHRYETEKKIKNEQLRNLNEKNERLSKELTQDRQQLNHIQYSLKRVNEELYTERAKLSTQESDLQAKLKLVDTLHEQQKVAKKDLDQVLHEQNQAQNKLYELEKSTAVLLIQIDALREETKEASSDQQSRVNELSTFEKAISELEAKLEGYQNNYDFLVQQDEELELQLAASKEQIETLTSQYNQESRLLDARENEYNLLKSLVDNLEGFPESIRFLKKNKKWDVKAPLFSDILYCQEAYRIAIENYLEPYMSYYVVERSEDALSAIQLLHDTAKGKAGFFVLDLIDHDEAKQPKHDHLVSALTVIDVDSKYHALCALLLKNVFFEREHRKPVADISLPTDEAVILSKSGQIVKKKHSLYGGSVGLFEGKRIGRAKNLSILQSEIQKTTKNQKLIEGYLANEKEKLKALTANLQKEQIQELSLQVNRLNNELISIKTKQEQYQSFIAHNQSRKEGIDKKIKDLTTELDNQRMRLERQKNDVSLFAGQLEYLQKDFDELSVNYNEQSSQYNQENITYHQQKNRTSNLEKDLEYREIQLENIETRIKQHEDELERTQLSLRELVNNADNSDVDLQEMYQQREQLAEGLNELERTYYSLRKEINDAEDRLTQERKNKDQSDLLLNEFKDKVNEINLELNALTERLLVEFNLEAGDLEDQETIDLEEDQLKEKTARLKKQLDEFGAINPLAMESFKEMDERYQFIKKEKNDLLEAKNTLLETIKEIDKTAKEKFMDAFNEVRENFIVVFRSLFSEEDTCDLVLSDPEQPLDSDILIIARPKGKKPLSINQLSGGEKTLTATALLFSLYLLKPAPFCIFDEVDAPLDDTNIDKFNNIIRKFSDKSQFIIVSHNKKTIASTDIIYGVTMVEQGISKLVAVDLQEV